jgi:hypothetical protein
MFVRFRERNGRRLIGLVETRRVDGKPRQEHIADLGAMISTLPLKLESPSGAGRTNVSAV